MKSVRLLLAALLILGIAFAGISVTNYTVSQPSYTPGESGVVTLTVSNPLLTGGTGYRMTGVSVSYFPPPEITTSGINNVGDIDAGGSTLLTVPIRVSKTAKSGIYLFEIKLTGYSSSSATVGQDVYAKSVSIPITIANTPLLSFSTSKSTIGGIDTVEFTISNSGGAAKSMRIRPASSTITLYGVDEVYLADVSGNTSLNMTLDSRNATDGPRDAVFTVTYDDEIGMSHTETKSVRMTVRKEELDLNFLQQGTLVTRKEGTLSFQVKNNGDALSDVRLSFLNGSLRMKDRNEIKVGDLAAGGSTTISESVYPDLAPGLNLVRARISWVEKDVRKEEDTSIPVTIGSDADVSVYLEAKPTPLSEGTEHTISVLVSNIGSYGIDNVDVGINSTGFELLDVTPRQYIGSLAKDDFSTVQFKMRAKSAGTYNIGVNVRYRDSSGEWVSKDLSQEAVVYAPAAAGIGQAMLLGLGLAVLVLALLVWWFGFRKKGGQQAQG